MQAFPTSTPRLTAGILIWEATMHFGRTYMPENVFNVVLISSLIMAGLILLALYLLSRPIKKPPQKKPPDPRPAQKSPAKSKRKRRK